MAKFKAGDLVVLKRKNSCPEWYSAGMYADVFKLVDGNDLGFSWKAKSTVANDDWIYSLLDGDFVLASVYNSVVMKAIRGEK